jgi:hypothetical protein
MNGMTSDKVSSGKDSVTKDPNPSQQKFLDNQQHIFPE